MASGRDPSYEAQLNRYRIWTGQHNLEQESASPSTFNFSNWTEALPTLQDVKKQRANITSINAMGLQNSRLDRLPGSWEEDKTEALPELRPISKNSIITATVKAERHIDARLEDLLDFERRGQDTSINLSANGTSASLAQTVDGFISVHQESLGMPGPIPTNEQIEYPFVERQGAGQSNNGNAPPKTSASSANSVAVIAKGPRVELPGRQKTELLRLTPGVQIKMDNSKIEPPQAPRAMIQDPLAMKNKWRRKKRTQLLPSAPIPDVKKEIPGYYRPPQAPRAMRERFRSPPRYRSRSPQRPYNCQHPQPQSSRSPPQPVHYFQRDRRRQLDWEYIEIERERIRQEREDLEYDRDRFENERRRYRSVSRDFDNGRSYDRQWRGETGRRSRSRSPYRGGRNENIRRDRW